MQAADYRDVAFHCQQAAEKALKALIVHRTRERPPYVHNLRELLSLVSDFAPPAPVIEAMLALNPHYRATRYPGVADDLDFVWGRARSDCWSRWNWFQNGFSINCRDRSN